MTMQQEKKIIVQRKPSWIDPSYYLFNFILPAIAWLPKQIGELFSLRTVVRILGGHGASPDKNEKKPFLPDCEHFTTEKITHALELIQSRKPLLNAAGERRIVLFFGWLTAKRRHIEKYARLFTDLGIDMLFIRLFPVDIIQPETGTQVVADQICDFLRQRRKYEKLLPFGCSGGGYLFCEVSMKVHKDPELLNSVFSKMVGQVYESPVDLNQINIAYTHTITSNPRYFRITKFFVDWFMNAFYDSMTRHYVNAAQRMYKSPVRAHALYIFSDNDPMSPYKAYESIADKWRAKGQWVRFSVFQHSNTGHCRNFARYPDKYKEEVYRFFVDVGFVEQSVVDRVLVKSQ
ncbi:Protein of unknown function DUF829 TMEM53 [Trinorchestia longiramus]|nr:Protein of unknown function DUF829 TMEM53 [Trinorchestia longiramus]